MTHNRALYGLHQGVAPQMVSLAQRMEAIRTESHDRANRINCIGGRGREFSDRRLAKTANLVFQTPPWGASASDDPRTGARRNYSSDRTSTVPGRRNTISKVGGEVTKESELSKAVRATRSQGETRRRELYGTKMGMTRATMSRHPATAPRTPQTGQENYKPIDGANDDADMVCEAPRPTIQRCERAPTSVAFVDANLQYRSHMEDGHRLIDRLFSSKDNQWSFYGVYDGHGGRLVTDKCLAHLHEFVLAELASIPGFPEACSDAVRVALEKSFATMDETLRTRDAWHCGATCTVVLIHTNRALGKKIYCANVGDSRCVLVCNNDKQSVRLSIDHRATDPEEIHRVQGEGGMISRGRVGGQLMLTRALGDFALKHVGVSNVPHAICRPIRTDDAVIIASDGLWDVLSDADAGRILQSVKHRHGNTKAAARSLVENAASRGSTDNITCVVVFA